MKLFLLLLLVSVSTCEWCPAADHQYRQVTDCGDCQEGDCRRSGNGTLETECYWNHYFEICQSGKGMFRRHITYHCRIYCVSDRRVDCGLGTSAPDCGGCGALEALCGGECVWLEKADLCVHTAVHMAYPYLSLDSSGVISKKFPGVTGNYKLTHTSPDSRHLVGYTLRKENKEEKEEEIIYHLFWDYKDSADSVFVSRVPFSRRGEDLVMFSSNWTTRIGDWRTSDWWVYIQRYSGQMELVRVRNVWVRFSKTDRRKIGECLNYG